MATNPVKQAPTTTIGTVATVTLTVLAWLVSHGVIPAGIAQTYGPWIVLVVLAAYFTCLWFHVSPWAKVQDLAEQLDNGRIPDADLARIESIVTDAVHGAEPPLTGTAHPDAAKVGPPATATLNAGAPPATA